MKQKYQVCINHLKRYVIRIYHQALGSHLDTLYTAHFSPELMTVVTPCLYHHDPEARVGWVSVR